ncbi:MAG: hypothetical protein U1D36_13660 [Hydrogenophaga sp.]|uniref:hypothetical protein n=1 Tax=Hydrogenophaga sp. TaxID=1904254 RepID=UPI00272F3B73|nr:hypothetical protein [Hydrogenophaga sp.]MDP2407112.1 hypothetical protein [Hydrogenophaga sp.]MDZ4175505.1 hypothetical protein [Hydrogenophaga sp.]
MSPVINKSIDVSVILALPVLYSLASGKPYAEALGASMAGGLLGMLIYLSINKIPAVKRYGIEQSALRKYAIGCVLFAVIGIPSFVTQANEGRQQEEIKSAIGAGIGKARGACEAANYMKKQYCPGFVIQKEIEIACSTNFSEYIPASIKGEVDRIFSSEKFRGEVRMIQGNTDEGFNIGKSKAIPLNELCRQYEMFVSDTYEKSLAEIASNSAKLK